MINILKHRSVKNAGWLIFGKIIQMLISLGVGLLTARYLGPSNYGLINYAASYTAFFIPVCSLGINSILVKEFIDSPSEEGTILGSTLTMRIIMGVLSSGVIFAVVGFLESDEPVTVAVTFICSLNLIFNAFEIFNYWFQSKLRSKVTAFVSLVAYIFMALYRVILLLRQKNVVWFAFATSLDSICIGILLLIWYKKSKGKRLSFSRTTCKRLLKRGVHFILPGMMVSIYSYADKIMLKHMLSETDVGYYSTAVTICGMWSFVLAAIVDSMYPLIMEAHKTSKELFEKRNKQLYAIVFYISVSVSLIFCIFGGLIVRILYGAEYMPSVEPLRIVTWYTAFSYLGVARNAWIVCENKQKYLKYIYISSALANVCLNYIFIPIWGASGAAAASLITQIITTMVAPFFIKEIRKNSFLMLEGIFLKKIR